MGAQPPLADWPIPETTKIDSVITVSLSGLCSVNGGGDERCTIVQLSLDRVTVVSAATVSFGDEVILSLPTIGLVKASVVQTLADGFVLIFEPATESKLGTYVTWLIRRGQEGAEDRNYPRIVPVKKLVTLERAGEPESMARIIDLSRSGVAFTTSKALVEGERIVVGTRQAHVTRVLEGGAAAQFVTALSEADFDVMIDLNRHP